MSECCPLHTAPAAEVERLSAALDASQAAYRQSSEALDKMTVSHAALVAECERLQAGASALAGQLQSAQEVRSGSKHAQRYHGMCIVVGLSSTDGTRREAVTSALD